MDARKELRRLIYDGLRGRKLTHLFRQGRDYFLDNGEQLSLTAFQSWCQGLKFPANRKRQNLLGDLIGGPCGEAIKKLPSPAFRGWRRRVMKEADSMAHGSAHGSEGRKARQFPFLPVVGEDGVRHMAPIIRCSQCGKGHTRQGRGGKMEDEQVFRKQGWEVGGSAAYDVCPTCVAARTKVVKMEDHIKKNGTKEQFDKAAPGSMSREDGRILSRLIEDHWDEGNKRYLPGWSDVKLAQEVSRPVEWVKDIRERDFGGVGEDPQLGDFLAAVVSVRDDLGGLHAHMEQLAASVSALSSDHDKVQRLLEKYKDAHSALAAKMKRVSEVADKLAPFEQKAG